MKLTRKEKAEKLSMLENIILYKYFIRNNPDTLIFHIAKEHLNEKEYKEYSKLHEEI